MGSKEIINHIRVLFDDISPVGRLRCARAARPSISRWSGCQEKQNVGGKMVEEGREIWRKAG